MTATSFEIPNLSASKNFQNEKKNQNKPKLRKMTKFLILQKIYSLYTIN